MLNFYSEKEKSVDKLHKGYLPGTFSSEQSGAIKYTNIQVEETNPNPSKWTMQHTEHSV